ncbi:efflux RND transporter periplasmic adaptor subunit [candidate division KSB1 bacterium]|nr:efflux RND transporter periplasmic adaptor subunit [candidate division KSB1 bacterium]RQW11397.1 MAG: efflux RND transporter periplasmic adaptor subunit [candidate division KSB1 bacterium]
MKKLLFVLVTGVFWLACGGNDVEIDTSITVPVSVEDVKLKPIEEFIETTGTARALQEVELVAQTDGFYRLGKNARNRPFTLGDQVSPADVIVYLDNPELENNTKIESQKLNLDISKSEFEKQQALYEKGGVTLRELKNAEQAYIDAKYNYDNAHIQLTKLKVQSPFRGVIVDLPYFTPGTRVSTNALIAKVMNYEKLYMDASYPGKHLGRIKVDQMVRALNYTMTEDTLLGRVTQVSPAIDSETRTFKASIEIDNPEWKFRPGMFIKVETIVAHKDSAIVIPKSIIVQSRGAKRVYIVERSAAHGRRIVTGLENPTHVEVVEGLQVDDRLIVKGYETLSDQTKVRIIR